MTPELWPALRLSLEISLLATLLAVCVVTPFAYLNARASYAGKSLLEGLIVAPMVLPPTVVGYALITLLGASGLLGRFLHRTLDYTILFRLEGAVLAAMVVAMPLLYLPTRAAFASVERELEDVARLLGASRLQLFWHVSVPLAARGLSSGIILAFARALGEFGATAMVFGIRTNQTTLPVSIYIDYESGDLGHALPAALLLFAISLVVTIMYNRSELSRQT